MEFQAEGTELTYMTSLGLMQVLLVDAILNTETVVAFSLQQMRMMVTMPILQFSDRVQ